MKINTESKDDVMNIVNEAEASQEAEASLELGTTKGPEYIKKKLEYKNEMEPWLEELIDKAMAQAEASTLDDNVQGGRKAPVRYLDEELDRLYKINVSEMAQNISDYNDYADDFNDAVDEIMDENPDLSEEDACLRVQESPEFKKYKSTYSEPLNLLIYGEPGGGKTSIVKDWADQHRIAICGFTGGTLTAKVLLGATAKGKAQRYNYEKEEVEEKDVAKILGNTSLDNLDKPAFDKEFDFAILFLDELNRADSFAQAALLDLIQSRSIADTSAPGGRRFFPKMLFTVAACNPPRTAKEKRGDSYLSQAMGTRFEWMYWNADPEQTRHFWSEKVWGPQVAKLQKQIDKIKSGDPRALKRLGIDENTSEDRKEELLKKALFGKVDSLKTLEQQIFLMDRLIQSGEFEFDSAAENEAAAEAQNFTTKGSDSKEYRKFLTLNARTLAEAVKRCGGNIAEFEDALKDCAGESKKVENAIDIAMKAKPVQDIRNGVFDGNLFGLADTAVKRAARRNGIDYYSLA